MLPFERLRYLARHAGKVCTRRMILENVYIPAGGVHVEENASDSEPLVVVISRNCPGSVVHYLDEERVEGEDPLAPFGHNAAARSACWAWSARPSSC